MSEPLPLLQLLDEWHRWAEWASSPNRDESLASQLVGWDDFDWTVQEFPEHAWQAVLAALELPQLQPHLGLLAAGPLEDLLSRHGPQFIDRAESLAKSNLTFAWMLGGVWQYTMPNEIWCRVQAVRDVRGWDRKSNDA